MKKIQINNEQLTNLAVKYAKDFIGHKEVSVPEWLKENLQSDYYANHVQVDSIADLSYKIVNTFGSDYQATVLQKLNHI